VEKYTDLFLISHIVSFPYVPIETKHRPAYLESILLYKRCSTWKRTRCGAFR